MMSSIRTVFVSGLVAASLVGAAWGVQAAQEKHPVLQKSIQQLEKIKDHLEQAPSDFGGHKAAAIEAINHAMNELHQAIAFDKK